MFGVDAAVRQQDQARFFFAEVQQVFAQSIQQSPRGWHAIRNWKCKAESPD